jgi:hypothetical protein
MAKSKAEMEFRETTIRVLSKLDTQIEQLILSVAQEREDRRELDTRLADALKAHGDSDDRRFDAIEKIQRSIEKKIWTATGGIVLLGAALQVFF